MLIWLKCRLDNRYLGDWFTHQMINKEKCHATSIPPNSNFILNVSLNNCLNMVFFFLVFWKHHLVLLKRGWHHIELFRPLSSKHSTDSKLFSCLEVFFSLPAVASWDKLTSDTVASEVLGDQEHSNQGNRDAALPPISGCMLQDQYVSMAKNRLWCWRTEGIDEERWKEGGGGALCLLFPVWRS